MRPSIPLRPSWHGRFKNSAGGPNPHVFVILSSLRKCVGGNIEFSTSADRRIFSRASQELDQIWRFGLTIGQMANPEKAALFDSDGDGTGELWIGAPRWASTNVEKIRAKSYGYDQTLELVEFDETLAYANLDAAITAGQPWAGFCYAPHYLFVLHDVHILEGPPYDPAKWNVVQPTDDPAWLEISDAGVAWDTAYLHVYYATELEDLYPEAASLFSKR